MRRLPPVPGFGLAAVAVLLVAACAPRAGSDAGALAPPVQTLPPGASGKLGADQVGAVSPVPAFRALGTGWRLQAEGIEGLRLSARLQRDGPGEQNATLRYDANRGDASPRTHVLAGTLYDSSGDRAIEVTLVRETCENAEGEHAWRAEVRIARDPALLGCADVAT